MSYKSILKVFLIILPPILCLNIELLPNINYRNKFEDHWFNIYNKSVVNNLIHEYNSIYQDYNISSDPVFQDCSNSSQADYGKICFFDFQKNLGPCSGFDNYGIKDRKPCIFLYLDNVITWTPLFYNNSNLVPDIPDTLKKSIDADNNKYIIWINCEGKTPADQENLGAVTYYPLAGFRQKYMIVEHIKGYRGPLVAIRLKEVSVGPRIDVICKIYAPNLSEEERVYEFNFILRGKV